MIYKNENFLIIGFSIVLQRFENFNNNKKITVISFVLSFIWNYVFEKIGK